MPRTIQASIAVDGERAFNSAMKEINSNLRALKAELNATESAFASQGQSADAYRAKQSKLTELYEQQKVKVETLRKALEEAKQKYGENSPQVDRLRVSLANAEAELNKMSAALGENAGEMDKMGTSAVDAAASMAVIVAGANKVADMLRECVSASTEFEAAMAAVGRTTGVSGGDLTAMGNTIQKLSTEIPVTTTELAGIAKTAGQLGISGAENIENFTVTVSKLATAAEMSTDQAATMMAQFANIAGTTEYERLASTIAVLGDSTATTAQKTLDMAQGIAAAGTLAGMSASDVIGIAAAVGSLGIEASAGGTSMSRLIQQLQMAVSTGKNLESWAKVAGMTANQFKVAWGTDAAGALDAFIRGLNAADKAGSDMTVTLSELGINSQRELAAVKGLAAQGDLLTRTLKMGAEAWDNNTGLAEKAATMFETTQAKMTMCANAANNLKIAIGDALAPAIGKGAEGLANLLEPLTEFVKEHPAVVQALATVTAGIIGLTAAVAAFNALKAAFAATVGAAFPPIAIISAVLGGVVAVTGAVSKLAEGYEAAAESEGRLGNDMSLDRAAENVIRYAQEREHLQKLYEQEGDMFMVKDGKYAGMFIEDALHLASEGLAHAQEHAAEASAYAAEEAAKLAEAQRMAAEEAGISSSAWEQMGNDVSVLVMDTMDQIDQLTEAYNTVYEAALESFEGQFSLFETAKTEISLSVEEMIGALDSQVEYWDTYSQNLKRAADAGISEGLVKALSDGSTQSAGYLAAICKAFDDAGGDMSTSSQELVNALNSSFEAADAKRQEMADLVAQEVTDFDNRMKELAQSAADNIDAMNVSGPAQAAAAATINAYIATIAAGAGPAASAAAGVAAAVAAALGAGGGGGGAGGTSWGRGGRGTAVYAEGTDYVPYDGQLAVLHKGEMVIPARISEDLRNFVKGQQAGSQNAQGTPMVINIYPQTMSEAQTDYLVDTLNRRLVNA